jgi:hypothetical protein
MSISPSDPTPSRTQRRLAVLGEWIRAGMDLARNGVLEAGRGFSDGAQALCRVFRAVRLAIILTVRLGEPHIAAFQPAQPKAPRRRSDKGQNAEGQSAEANTPHEKTADEKVQAEKPEPARPPRFAGDLLSDAAFLRRPLAEIVKEICAALGLTPDWTLWSEADETPDAAAAPPSLAQALARLPIRPISVPDRLSAHPPTLRPQTCRPQTWRPPTGPEPAVGRLLTRLRSSCAPLALDPLAALASGRVRLAKIG